MLLKNPNEFCKMGMQQRTYGFFFNENLANTLIACAVL